MAWKKSPPELIELLEEILPKDPRAERRKMFGYPRKAAKKPRTGR